METTEQQQIAQQKETIESLTKTVERLEKELQKCLEPEAGEYQFKKPEPQEGKKCEFVPQQCLRLEDNLGQIMDSLFLPSRRLNEHNSKTEPVYKYSTWSRLQYLLLTDDSFSDLWKDENFRSAITDLNAIVEELKVFNNCPNDAPEILGDRLLIVNEDSLKGTCMIRDAVKQLYSIEEKNRMDLERQELDELYISLCIIAECQRLTVNADNEME